MDMRITCGREGDHLSGISVSAGYTVAIGIFRYSKVSYLLQDIILCPSGATLLFRMVLFADKER